MSDELEIDPISIRYRKQIASAIMLTGIEEQTRVREELSLI